MPCLQVAGKPAKVIHLLAIVYDIAESRLQGVRCEVPRHCHHDDIYVTHAKCQIVFAIVATHIHQSA